MKMTPEEADKCMAMAVMRNIESCTGEAPRPEPSFSKKFLWLIIKVDAILLAAGLTVWQMIRSILQ